MPRDDFIQSGYTEDGEGRRVMIGLDFAETRDFERIDARLPFGGKPVWPRFGEDLPLLPMEKRWLELWEKHQAALQAEPLRSSR